MNKKLFIGSKLRKLRQQHKLSQSECAERLGLSHSYLNQLENNQRPITASVLIKLSRSFDVDISQLSDDKDKKLADDINLSLKDESLGYNHIEWREIEQFVQQLPDIASGFSQLYRQHTRLKEEYEQLVSRFYGDQHTAHLTPLPHESVRDFFYQNNNYIDILDQAAESLLNRSHTSISQLNLQLSTYLNDELNITVNTEPGLSRGFIKFFCHDKNILYLSENLNLSQQCFQMASQIALSAFKPELDELCNNPVLHNQQTQVLARIGLANYFAGALIMPYREFLRHAESSRYDIETLQREFNVSAEQVYHRLSTLQRKNHCGVPFYFVRVDQAGNISKRQSATSFSFTKTGGACPLWNIHDAFNMPLGVHKQIAQMPDGQHYFCLAQQVIQGGGKYHSTKKRFVIGLGCELEHAHRLVYSKGMDLKSSALVTPIGPGCRVCSREHCAQRAFPRAGQRLDADCNIQSLEPYGSIKTI